MLQWGEKIDFLLEMSALGLTVPALENRPELPAHAQIVHTAYRDLIYDGTIRFGEYVVWAERYCVSEDQFDYIWDALGVALGKVATWRKSASKNSEKTTGISETRQAGSPEA